MLGGPYGPWPGPGRRAWVTGCVMGRACSLAPFLGGDAWTVRVRGRSLAPASLNLPRSVPAPWLRASMPCRLPWASACPPSSPAPSCHTLGLTPTTLETGKELKIMRKVAPQFHLFGDLGKHRSVTFVLHLSDGIKPSHRLREGFAETSRGSCLPPCPPHALPSCRLDPFLCDFAHAIPSALTISLNPSHTPDHPGPIPCPELPNMC